MSDLIGSSRSLSAEAQATLSALAGTIIPASASHRVPGADDPQILSDIIRSAGPALAAISEGLRELDALSGLGGFSAAESEARLELAERFRAGSPAVAGLVTSLVCQCYYRDPRVLESLGMAPRPPFPQGFEVDEGDWSLLDPVRKRGPLYRPV